MSNPEQDDKHIGNSHLTDDERAKIEEARANGHRIVELGGVTLVMEKRGTSLDYKDVKLALLEQLDLAPNQLSIMDEISPASLESGTTETQEPTDPTHGSQR